MNKINLKDKDKRCFTLIKKGYPHFFGKTEYKGISCQPCPLQSCPHFPSGGAGKVKETNPGGDFMDIDSMECLADDWSCGSCCCDSVCEGDCGERGSCKKMIKEKCLNEYCTAEGQGAW